MFPQLYELICIYTYNIYRCLKKQIKENADFPIKLLSCIR